MWPLKVADHNRGHKRSDPEMLLSYITMVIYNDQKLILNPFFTLNHKIPPDIIDSRGKLAIPLMPKNMDMKIGNWTIMGIVLERGLILFFLKMSCISIVYETTSWESPRFLASDILA